jgi:nucleoside-diphosphate-sugar epimerase
MSTDAQKRLFCFGFGYTAEHLATTLLQRGDWEIAGTTRDKDKKDELRARGIDACLFERDFPLGDPLYMLRGTTHLLLSVPPDSEGDPVYRQHANDIARLKTLEWAGYLSATSVYGDRNGGWVDEGSETRPSSIRGSRRARAESQWQELRTRVGIPLHIFRLAGIYGPGRSALDSVRAGIARRVDKPGQAFSRAHIGDIVRVLLASMDAPDPGNIYNVCDDHPAPSHEVIASACELLNIDPPPLVPFEEANLPPMARSFYRDNKRVRNNKIKDRLGVVLQYPDYETGLKACLEAEQASFQPL